MKNVILPTAWGLLCLFLLANWSHEATIEAGKKILIDSYQVALSHNNKKFQPTHIVVTQIQKIDLVL